MGSDGRASPIGQARLKSGCPLIAALLAPLTWHVGADPHRVHGSRMTWEGPLVATTLAPSGPLLRVHPKFVNGTVEDPIPEKARADGRSGGQQSRTVGSSTPPSPPPTSTHVPDASPQIPGGFLFPAPTTSSTTRCRGKLCPAGGQAAREAPREEDSGRPSILAYPPWKPSGVLQRGRDAPAMLRTEFRRRPRSLGVAGRCLWPCEV